MALSVATALRATVVAALLLQVACNPGAELYLGPDAGGARDSGGGRDARGTDRSGADTGPSDRALTDVGVDAHQPRDAAVSGIDVLPGTDASVLQRDSGASDAQPQVCTQPRKAGGSLMVVNGTREPTLVPLSSAQKLAAVGISNPWDGWYCSGTLISRDIVLTAKHCTEQAAAGDVTVSFSITGSSVYWECGVTRFYLHSTADLALFELNADPVAAIGVAPVPINPQALDSSWIGVRVEAAGWGSTVSNNTGYYGRFFVAEPIYAINATEITVNGAGVTGLCFGDSGGPVFGVVGSGSIRTLGALSWGDTNCVGLDRYLRADVFLSWIETYAGPTPPLETSACGSETSAGHCEGGGTRAVYCDNDQLVQDTCQSPTPVCGWSTVAQGYRCISTAIDPCQGLDALGECQGAVSRWCDSGQLRSFDCSQCGWGCGWVNDSVGYDCSEGGTPTDPCLGHANCSGIDYLGTCQGDTLYWCEPDDYGVCQLWQIVCTDYGRTCGWHTAEDGYACLQ